MRTRRRESPSICVFLLTRPFADLDSLDEKEVLDGDIEKMIVPYATANFWVRSNSIHLRV